MSRPLPSRVTLALNIPWACSPTEIVLLVPSVILEIRQGEIETPAAWPSGRPGRRGVGRRIADRVRDAVGLLEATRQVGAGIRDTGRPVAEAGGVAAVIH